MIRSKGALIGAAMLLCICLYLTFSISDAEKIGARSQFMTFPINYKDGYILFGIIGSILFIIALFLIVLGLKRYRFRTVAIVAVLYGLSPLILMTLYQETLASGIDSISYDGNGECHFESIGEEQLKGECNFILHNHSNEAVSFELDFLDSNVMPEAVRMESLMNLAGPYYFTIEANEKRSFDFNEILEVSGVPDRIEWGNTAKIHFKLMDGGNTRIL